MQGTRGASERPTILFLAANPSDKDPLALDKEANYIEERVLRAGRSDVFDIQCRFATTAKDLMDEMNRLKPEVIHFCGHGSRKEGIYLVDPANNAVPVAGEELARRIKSAANPVLIVLNACWSAEHAKALKEVAQCVIGMTVKVDDDEAREFAGQLYSAFAFGLNARQAVGQASTNLEGFDDWVLVEHSVPLEDVFLVSATTETENAEERPGKRTDFRASNDIGSSQEREWKDSLKRALRKCLSEPVPEEILEALRRRFDMCAMATAELIDAAIEWIDDPRATLAGRANEIAALPKLVESEPHKRLCRRFGRMLIPAHPVFRRFSARYDAGAKDVYKVERGYHPMLAQLIIAHAHTAEPGFLELSSTVYLGRGELPGTEIEVGPGPEGTKKLVACVFHTLGKAEGLPVELDDDLYRWVTSAFDELRQGRSPPHDQYTELRQQLNTELGERRSAFEDEIRLGVEPEIYPAYCVFWSNRVRAPRYDRMARALKKMLPNLIVFRFEYDASDMDEAAVDALKRLFKDP